MGVVTNVLSRHDRLKLPLIRCPREVGWTDLHNYYLFHQMIVHSTKNGHTLKVILQTLIDADVHKLHLEQKSTALEAPTTKDHLNPTSSYSVVCAILKDADSDILALSDLNQETVVLAAQVDSLLIVRARSDQSYLKQFDSAEVSTAQTP